MLSLFFFCHCSLFSITLSCLLPFSPLPLFLSASSCIHSLSFFSLILFVLFLSLSFYLFFFVFKIRKFLLPYFKDVLFSYPFSSYSHSFCCLFSTSPLGLFVSLSHFSFFYFFILMTCFSPPLFYSCSHSFCFLFSASLPGFFVFLSLLLSMSFQFLFSLVLFNFHFCYSHSSLFFKLFLLLPPPNSSQPPFVRPAPHRTHPKASCRFLSRVTDYFNYHRFISLCWSDTYSCLSFSSVDGGKEKINRCAEENLQCCHMFKVV